MVERGPGVAAAADRLVVVDHQLLVAGGPVAGRPARAAVAHVLVGVLAHAHDAGARELHRIGALGDGAALLRVAVGPVGPALVPVGSVLAVLALGALGALGSLGLAPGRGRGALELDRQRRRVGLLVDLADRLEAVHQLLQELAVLVGGEQEVVLGLVQLPAGLLGHLGQELGALAVAQRHRARGGLERLDLQRQQRAADLLEGALELAPVLAPGAVEHQGHVDVGVHVVERREQPHLEVAQQPIEGVLDRVDLVAAALALVGLAHAEGRHDRVDPFGQRLGALEARLLVLARAFVRRRRPAVEGHDPQGVVPGPTALGVDQELARGRGVLADQADVAGLGRDEVPAVRRLELEAQVDGVLVPLAAGLGLLGQGLGGEAEGDQGDGGEQAQRAGHGGSPGRSAAARLAAPRSGRATRARPGSAGPGSGGLASDSTQAGRS